MCCPGCTLAGNCNSGCQRSALDALGSLCKLQESTNEATLLRTGSREATGGVPLYTLEYALDSTRGAKRTLTAVTIASKKLYILNIAYKDSREQPAPSEFSELMHQVLNSFDLAA